jgi:hypothetical protein
VSDRRSVIIVKFGENPMTDGEILYLAIVSGVTILFMLALAYASNIASNGPEFDD